MTARAAAFKVMGMNRDLSESAFDSKFAYENMNMRLTSTGSNTTLSLTNERGNRLVDLGSTTIPTSNSGDEEYDYIVSGIVGMAIGYAVLDDILVVFTTDCTWEDETIEIDDRTVNKVSPVGNDAIYKLVMEDGEPHLVDVWIGDLGFDAKHPIETLSNYEAEKVRKVYWVDGLNQMRVINVAGDIYGIDSSHFDFSPGLEGGESVEIERIESSLGTFPSGCVQYFFTYFNKYGQESGIFYASTLLYASPSDRGGRADESCTCYFNVKLSGLSGKYDYVRVYAIHRTSLNTEVAAYIVGEYEIMDSVNDEHTVEFNDYGTSLTTIDSSELLFKEHEPIIAGTITRKDQRLFAGNVSLDTRYQLTDEQADELASCVSVSEDTKELPYVEPEGVYPYRNNLNLGEDAVKGFKGGEWYRVAVQLQSKVGTWTEPVFVGDFQVKTYPRIDNATSYVPCLKVTLTRIPDWIDGYIAIRAMLADPLDGYKSIMCQGVLCPTMYNTRNRYDNAPHAVASWFMRPIVDDVHEDVALHFRHNDCVASSLAFNGELQTCDYEWQPIIYGLGTTLLTVTFHHRHSHYSCTISVTDSTTGSALVDSIFIKQRYYDLFLRQVTHYIDESIVPAKDNWPDNDLTYNTTPSTDLLATLSANKTASGYYMDQNIVTLHSPDINDASFNKLDGNNFKLRIVGLVPITAGYMSYDVQSSGSLYNPNLQGLLPVCYDESNISDLFYGLISAPLWNDGLAYGNLILDYSIYEARGCDFATYPWHRNGSLNDDDSSTKDLNEDGIAQTSVLEKKAFSNLRFSYRPFYFNDGSVDVDSHWNLDEQITVNVFNSDEVTAVPLNADGDRKLYYGNVDAIVTAPVDIDDSSDGTNYDNVYGTRYSEEKSNNKDHDHRRDGYLIAYGSSVSISKEATAYEPLRRKTDRNNDGADGGEFLTGTDPVNIKYKSTQHAAFSLGSGIILPAIELPGIVEDDSGNASTELKAYNEAAVLDGISIADVASTGFKETIGQSYALLYDDPVHFWWPDNTVSGMDRNSVGIAVMGTLPEVAGYYDDKLYAVFARITSNDGSTFTMECIDDYAIGDVLYVIGRKDIDDGISRSGYVRITAIRVGSVYVGFRDTSTPGEEFTETTCYIYEDCAIPGTVGQDTICLDANHTIMTGLDDNSGFLYLAELYRTSDEDMNLAVYGQQTKEALRLNTWTVNSEAVAIAEGANMSMIGDTFFGRWDCLKTYAFSTEDKNQVVDITSFMVESSINLDGRTDRNRGVKDNTVMSPTNFNLFNTVYDQKDNYFTYNITDNTITQYEFPNTIIWSLLKTNGELVDTWTAIIMNSYLDMDGGCGKVTSLNRVDNNVVCFQENATAQILYNETMQMTTTDGVPVEIANSGAVNGKRYLSDSVGVYNKWAVVETSMGIYFVDDFGRTLNLLSADMKITCICDGAGFHSWYHEALETPTVWNPVDFGMTLQYDEANQDLLTVTGSDCLAFSERMGAFSSFYSYGWTPYFANIRGKVVTLHPTDGGTEIYIQNEGEYNEFFGELHGYGTTVIVNGNDVSDYSSKSSFRTDKTFDTVEFRSDSWVDGKVDHDMTFDMLRVWNEYQNAEMVLDRRIGYPSPLKKKFRVWRAMIPREKGSYGRHGNRIRNPWAYVSLEKRNPEHEMTVLHDIVVNYTE